MSSEIEIYDQPAKGKDYIVQVRIKNGPLLRAIRMRGYKSVRAFSVACGMHVSHLYPYFSLMKAPLTKTGKWSLTVLSMAKVLRLPPDSLFPEQHLEFALKRSTGEMEVSSEEVAALIAPEPALDVEESLEREQTHQRLYEFMSELTPREERVLRLRFGFTTGDKEYSLEEVANEYDVHRERVRQIEAKALRKLKHPSRSKKLIASGGYGFLENSRRSEDRFYHSDFNVKHTPQTLMKYLEAGFVVSDLVGGNRAATGERYVTIGLQSKADDGPPAIPGTIDPGVTRGGAKPTEEEAWHLAVRCFNKYSKDRTGVLYWKEVPKLVWNEDHTLCLFWVKLLISDRPPKHDEAE